jgi:hypothetical protein
MLFSRPKTQHASHRKTSNLVYTNAIPVAKPTPPPASTAAPAVDSGRLGELLSATRQLQMTTTKTRDTAAVGATFRATSAGQRTAADVRTAAAPVLLFTAHFSEDLAGGAAGPPCVRHVKIYLYTADDTVAVYEPPVANSGLPQGELVSRSKVPRADRPGYFVTWRDVNVAQDVVFFGRTYRVTGCNASTEEFLYTNGVDVNAPEHAPQDAYLTLRSTLERPQHPASPQGPDRYYQVRVGLVLGI